MIKTTLFRLQLASTMIYFHSITVQCNHLQLQFPKPLLIDPAH